MIALLRNAGAILAVLLIGPPAFSTQWKWEPAKLSGHPVKVLGEITISFQTESRMKGDVPRASSAHLAISSPTDPISAQEAAELAKRLEEVAPVQLQIKNISEAPLAIASATVRTVRREASTSASSVDKYAARLDITLTNDTDRRISGATLQFVDAQSSHIFNVGTGPISLDPKKQHNLAIPLMSLASDPAGLTVEVAGGRFEDESTWGAFPFSRPLPPPPTFAESADTKPKPLNSPRPSYTQQARKNKVQGTVRLQLLVGADGGVEELKVLNALPDGLTDEAIRAVQQIKFQPATKDGQPISYRISIDIAFDLR